MLIQFRVENFKSFDDEQKLSMVAGTARNNSDHIYSTNGLKVLKTAAIFGSNASGKSNLIYAMSCVQHLVLFGRQIPTKDYCRVKANNEKKPTGFEFTVSIGNKKYAYGLELILSSGEIKNEWFIDISKNKTVTIFKRNGEITTDLDLKGESEYFRVYRAEAQKNKKRPFLSILSRIPTDLKSELKAVHKMMSWFSYHLRIIVPNQTPGFGIGPRRDQFTQRMLPTYGTGVSNIEYHNLDYEENPIPPDIVNNMVRNLPKKPRKNEMCGIIETIGGKYPVFIDEKGKPVLKKMMFNHDGTLFEMYEESEGTNRLFDLTPILDPQDEVDLVYVIDELDRSLHPQITKKFVDDFEKLHNKLRRQLITTTHESRLMDLDLLRRDEIWLIDKKKGISELYSLEEFNERNDRRVDKAYLEGRYGGVPCFRTIFPDLEEQ